MERFLWLVVRPGLLYGTLSEIGRQGWVAQKQVNFNTELSQKFKKQFLQQGKIYS